MKIKTKEAIFAIVNFICVKLFIVAPQNIINISKNSSWIFVIINTAFTLATFLVLYFLYKKCKKKAFLSFIPSWLSKLFSIIVFVYLVTSAGLTLELLIKGVIRSFLPTVPSLYISAFFIFSAIFAAKKGVATNVQLSMLISPLLLIIPLLFIVLIPYYDISEFFPIFGNGNFFVDSLYKFNFFADFIVFFILLPYLEDGKKSLKIGISSILISGFLYLITIVADILIIPDEVSFFSPFYQMILFMSDNGSVVSLMRMLQLIFIPNFFLYISSAVALSAECLGRSFDLKYKQELVPSIAALILLIEQIQYNSVSVVDVYAFLMNVAILIYPAVPLIAFLYGSFKRRKLC